MPAGLQCWDANGKVIYDSTVTTSIYCGTITINGTSGSITDDRLIGRNFWTSPISKTNLGDFDRVTSGFLPQFSANGNKLSWDYSSVSSSSNRIKGVWAYGVY